MIIGYVLAFSIGIILGIAITHFAMWVVSINKTGTING